MQKRFQKIHIEISNICNLQCSFCPEVERKKGMMDIATFERVIRQVAPLTEQVAFHLMGDPLVHRELETFVAICHEFKTPINFVTNGLLLREDKIDLLMHPIFRQVNFSLHSFPDNFPSKDPSDYLDKIFSFTDKALLVRPDLYINYRLWNLADTRGTSEKNLEMLEKIESHYGVTTPREIEVTSKKSINLKQRLYLHYDTEFIWPALHLPILGTSGFCYGMKSHIGILVDGTVVPCCLDKEGGIPLGNIKQQDLLEILESPRALALVKGFQNRKLVENLCQRCQYIERFK